MCVCMCVCILGYTHTHIHTHTYIYAYVGSKEGGNISSTTFHPKVDEYPKCQQGWEKKF